MERFLDLPVNILLRIASYSRTTALIYAWLDKYFRVADEISMLSILKKIMNIGPHSDLWRYTICCCSHNNIEKSEIQKIRAGNNCTLSIIPELFEKKIPCDIATVEFIRQNQYKICYSAKILKQIYKDQHNRIATFSLYSATILQFFVRYFANHENRIRIFKDLTTSSLMSGSQQNIDYIRNIMSKNPIFIRNMKTYFGIESINVYSAKDLTNYAIGNWECEPLNFAFGKNPQATGKTIRPVFISNLHKFQSMGLNLDGVFKYLDIPVEGLLNLAVNKRCSHYAGWAIDHGAKVTNAHYMLALKHGKAFGIWEIYRSDVPMKFEVLNVGMAIKYGYHNLDYILHNVKLPPEHKKIISLAFSPQMLA